MAEPKPTPTGTATKTPHHRSPNYPADGLSDGLKSVQSLYEKASTVPVDQLTAARAMGFGTLHGKARSRIGALRKYGLLETIKGGNLRLTPLAMSYVLPASPEEKQRAIDAAGLRPALFRELFERRDAGNEVLKSMLVRASGFSSSGAEQAIKAFRDTMTLVKATEAPHNSQDNDLDEDEDSVNPEPISQATSKAPPPLSGGLQAVRATRWQTTVTLDEPVAELKVVSGRAMRVGDLRRIKRLLDANIDAAIEAMEESASSSLVSEGSDAPA